MPKRSKLEEHYATLAEATEVYEAPEYADLVVPNGNAQRAIHRWFHVKEGYSCDLLARFLPPKSIDGGPEIVIVDPFSGSGTTAVSAAELAALTGQRFRAIGIETNPFLAHLGATKAEAVSYRPELFKKALEEIDKRWSKRGNSQPKPPELSTFTRVEYFDPHNLRRLLQILSAVETADIDPIGRNLSKVALAAGLEDVSRLRRDGRALRFTPNRTYRDPKAAFDRRTKQMLQDLPAAPPPGTYVVHRGDGRLANEVVSGKIDFAIFSPPYPNNIDYTEVYKLEGWLLGLYETRKDFLEQRHRTLRSHPSVSFTVEDNERETLDYLVGPIIKALPNDRYRIQRERTIFGYASDMNRTIQNLRSLLRDQGKVVIVVGNSLHGVQKKVLIAADLLIAKLAMEAGLKVHSIAVARRPSRRRTTSPLLRESIITCEKI